MPDRFSFKFDLGVFVDPAKTVDLAPQPERGILQR